MKTYTVTWEIEIDAETPEEAARKALEVQRDATSIATCFDVYDGFETKHIDFTEMEERIRP